MLIISSMLSLSNCGYVVAVHVLCAWLISLTNTALLVKVACTPSPELHGNET